MTFNPDPYDYANILNNLRFDHAQQQHQTGGMRASGRGFELSPIEAAEKRFVQQHTAPVARGPYSGYGKTPGVNTTFYGNLMQDRFRRGASKIPVTMGQVDAENMQLINQYPDSPALAQLRKQYGL